MRTVLDRATQIFEAGFAAYSLGIHRADNPYPKGDDRANWFAGWDRAQECNGTCDG